MTNPVFSFPGQDPNNFFRDFLLPFLGRSGIFGDSIRWAIKLLSKAKL
jgi:hypothetical protein